MNRNQALDEMEEILTRFRDDCLDEIYDLPIDDYENYEEEDVINAFTNVCKDYLEIYRK